MKLELILLGLLKKQPLHGYKIKEIIKREITPLTNVSLTSIYYTLDKLAKNGYLKKTVDREGNRPEKYVYSLTTKGNRYFQRLFIRNFLIIERPFFNLDLGLYFLNEFSFFGPKQLVRVIDKRIQLLNDALQWAQELKKKLAQEGQAPSRIAIPEHLEKLLKAEIEFIKELKQNVG